MESRYKVIKTEAEYRAGLARFEELLDMDESERDEDEIELLSLLIKKYEDEQYPIEPPDPIDAIKFRMEQAGLKPKDLIPYIGSRSKVSEILSGKRDLTLSMIRALNKGLGIPYDSLVKEPNRTSVQTEHACDLEKLPFADMEKNGAFIGFDTEGNKPSEYKKEALQWLVSSIGGLSSLPAFALKKNNTMRLNATFNHHALLGWSMQVLRLAKEIQTDAEFQVHALDEKFITSLVALSMYEDGPRRAQAMLMRAGIIFLTVKQLPRTHLDGAVFWPEQSNPTIALTLRYDRIDNFWFVLLHELGHLALGHIQPGTSYIADNLELPASGNEKEQAADDFAAAALLPSDFNLHERDRLSAQDILDYAKGLQVHPAIVAGRIRYLRKDYRTFSRLLGHGQVRRLFFENNM